MVKVKHDTSFSSEYAQIVNLSIQIDDNATFTSIVHVLLNTFSIWK